MIEDGATEDGTTEDGTTEDGAPRDLDTLSTEDLRHRAFEVAEHRHDVSFFWELIRHLPSSGDVASEDASAGNITGGIVETVQLVRGLFGKGRDYTSIEPLLRARYLDYLREHPS